MTNPYSPLIDVAQESSSRAHTTANVAIACVLTTILTTLLYIPFRFVAAITNIYTWAYTDDFYYTFATAVWPAFATAVGLGHRMVLRSKPHKPLDGLIIGLVGLLSLPGTWLIDYTMGFWIAGRIGFFYWPSYFGGFSTPMLSSILIVPMYAIGWYAVAKPTRMRNHG